MKFPAIRLFCASALALLLSAPAQAAFEGATAAPAAPVAGGAGGFKGPAAATAVDTVAKALTARDDSACVLEGRILSGTAEREHYIFQDASGKIEIELDDEIFAGRTVTPENTVRLYGEVDTRFGRDSKVEVDRMDILK